MKLFLKKLFYHPNFWFAIAVLLSIFVIFNFSKVEPKLNKQAMEVGVAKKSAEMAAKIEVAKKSAEKSQKTETELSKEMLDVTVDFETRMGVADAWAKKHVSNKVEKCATYKKKVYSSNIDPQLKDLLWRAAVVASEYCWEVDAQPVPVPTAKSKTAKPKQKKAESRLK